MKTAPDFFIIGGPRCGTTSLYETLRSRSDVYMSAIKEPHYYATSLGLSRSVTDAEAYRRLFTRSKSNQKTGEASILYLSLDEPVPRILLELPQAKFISLVRQPIDMFLSWHNHCVTWMDESESDPERAWWLQAQRVKGVSIPRKCHVPYYLQYRDICSQGFQIARLYERVPPEQRLTLLFDDLVSDPTGVFKQVANFLEIHDDGNTAIQNLNGSASGRINFVTKISRTIKTHPALNNARVRIKPILNSCGITFFEGVVRKNFRPSPAREISESFRNYLLAELEADVALLERTLRRDLSHWKRTDRSSFQMPGGVGLASDRVTG